MSCKLNGLFEEGAFVQSEFEMTGANGLEQLLEIAEMRVVALGAGENIINIWIGGWNCCKMCGNDTLEHCGGNFETLWKETKLKLPKFATESCDMARCFIDAYSVESMIHVSG